MRWEKVTRLFLRTAEFLWQEGHTFHATPREAEEETLKMLGVYQDFVETELAIPVMAGAEDRKARSSPAPLRTYSDRGADAATARRCRRAPRTTSASTSRKAFEITFQDKDGVRKYAWQTSWGVSTRIIGAIIMAHGDDSGLMLPPRVAPIQVDHRADLAQGRRQAGRPGHDRPGRRGPEAGVPGPGGHG